MTEYVPLDLTGSVLASARNMRHLGTQFACAKSDVDIHDHSDRYYTKAEEDAKYFYPGHMGTGIGPDADTVDGLHYSELIGSLVPVGMCFGWNGTDADVPDNWHIADGSTVGGLTLPDVRSKILMGAGTVHVAQSSGGALTLSTAGGTITIEGHVLTIDEIPAHYHNALDVSGHASEIKRNPVNENMMGDSTTTAKNTEYNHDTTDAAHGAGTKNILLDPFSIVPPWFCKYLIVKVA